MWASIRRKTTEPGLGRSPLLQDVLSIQTSFLPEIQKRQDRLQVADGKGIISLCEEGAKVSVVSSLVDNDRTARFT